MKKTIFAVLMLLSLKASAAEPKNLETDWTWNQYYGNSSAASSTHAVQGVGFSYSVKAVGGNVNFNIAVTTRTYTASLALDVSSVTTSLITVPAGSTLKGTFEAMAVNPTLVIHGMSTSATSYVYITYGEAKKQ